MKWESFGFVWFVQVRLWGLCVRSVYPGASVSALKVAARYFGFVLFVQVRPGGHLVRSSSSSSFGSPFGVAGFVRVRLVCSGAPHAWCAPARTRRTRTNPATARAHANEHDELKRTRQPPGRILTNQTTPFEPSDTQVTPERTRRTRRIPATPRAHQEEADEHERTQRPHGRIQTNPNDHPSDTHGAPGKTRRTRSNQTT